MSHFGGDDIDKMLEEADSKSLRHGKQQRGSLHAVPPPPQLLPGAQTSHSKSRVRDGRDGRDSRNRRNYSRSRSRSRSRDRMKNMRERNDRTDRNDRGERGDRYRGGNRNSRERGQERETRDTRDTRDSRDGRDGRDARDSRDTPYDLEARRKERELRREQQDIERDQRTVFACQIHPKCDERDIFEFFSVVGKVVDIQLIRDNRTFKSKGLCYVEFAEKATVSKALALSQQLLGGFPINVQLTQAEKHRAAQAAEQAKLSSQPMKLYISNINKKVTSEDLEPLFKSFGDTVSLEIKRDHRGKSQGYGFVEFKRESDALGCMQELNDLEIIGQKIKLAPADLHRTTPASGTAAAGAGAGAGAVGGVGAAVTAPGVISGASSDAVNATASVLNSTQSRANVIQNITQKIGANVGGSGVNAGISDIRGANSGIDGNNIGNLNDNQRDEILDSLHLRPVSMTETTAHARQQKNEVQKQHMLENVHPSRMAQMGYSVKSQQQQQQQQTQQIAQSRCVLLQGMFDPATESDPDFDLDIREDVRDEVSRHGKLLHIYVDKTSRDGLVYLKFNTVEEAQTTVKNLDKRWFAKRQIKANFFNESQYSAAFPDS